MAQTNNSDKQVIRAALWVSMIGSFFTPFMGASINIALPEIGQDLDMNAIMLSWVASSFILASSMVLVPVGRIADIIGRKRVYFTGIIIFTLATLLCSISFSGTMLIVSRAIQGFGGALMFTTSLALVLSVYPKEKRGRAVGYVTATVYVGLALGPSLGGVLTQYFGWRSLFFLNIPPGLAIIFIIVRYLKGEWAEAKGEKFDIKGAFFYASGILFLIYGLTRMPDIQAIGLVTTGIILLIIFIVIQLKISQPLINISLLIKNRAFAYSNLAALINYAATFGVGFLLSIYLQYVKGFSPRDAGLILVSQPVMMACISPFAGRLSDKINPGILASIGMTISVAGLTIISFAGQQTSIITFIISLSVLGCGFGLFSSPNTNAVMSAVDKKDLGIASATLGTMRLLGQMLSMVIVMLAINLIIGKLKLSAEISDKIIKVVKHSFYLFSLLCFLGIFASLARGKKS